MVESKKGEDHDQVKVKTLGQYVVVKERKKGRMVVRRKGHATKIGMEKRRRGEEKRRLKIEKSGIVFLLGI